MGKWIFEMLSKFYEQLQKGIFDWKIFATVAIAITVLAVWKQKVWLRPIKKYFSNFQNNSNNARELKQERAKLKGVVSGIKSAMSKLESRKAEFGSSVSNIRANFNEVVNQNKRSTSLVKSRSKIESELDNLTRIYGESLSDLEHALETIESNMRRADQRDMTRDQDVDDAFKKHW
jgi:prophage DNA circulation protein